MMLNIPDNYGQVPTGDQAPYLPYISVRDELLDDPEVPIGDMFEAVQLLRKGLMPEKGAVVDLGGGLLGAFDLVAVERLSAREVIITPAAKLAVDNQTDQLTGQGVVTLTDDSGRLKVVSVVDTNRGLNGWGRLRSYRVGGIILGELGISAPCYEVVEEDAGLVRAISRF